jgi:hypothetical protein
MSQPCLRIPPPEAVPFVSLAVILELTLQKEWYAALTELHRSLSLGSSVANHQ